MKKSLIALAVAGAMTVPAIASADATLYGWMTMAVDKAKDEKLDINTDGNSPSRIGLKGTADTGIDGLTALYQYEFRVNQAEGETALATRLANVGLTGNWGTVLAGTQWAPHYSWVTATTDVMLSSVVGPTHSTDTVYRVSNSMAYVSPEFSGLQLAAAVGADADNDDENGDWYHVAAKYSNGGFYGALSYIDFNSEVGYAPLEDVTALALSYSFGAFTVAGVYSDLETSAGDYKPWDLSATYALTDATTLKAAYADFDDNGKGYGVEVQHDLSNMVNTFVGYGHANTDLRDTYEASAGTAGANSVFSTGIRVKF
ncbi:porin [Nitrincola sp.]|uniref:porin n=1 Tax=Nitrincola sp. TaxID=1926584 RepID=UPI003A93EC5C